MRLKERMMEIEEELDLLYALRSAAEKSGTVEDWEELNFSIDNLNKELEALGLVDPNLQREEGRRI